MTDRLLKLRHCMSEHDKKHAASISVRKSRQIFEEETRNALGEISETVRYVAHAIMFAFH